MYTSAIIPQRLSTYNTETFLQSTETKNGGSVSVGGWSVVDGRDGLALGKFILIVEEQFKHCEMNCCLIAKS